MNKYAVDKIIKASPENEKGDIIFENDFAKISFNKNDVLKALSTTMNLKWASKCDKMQIAGYETNIRNSTKEVNLFTESSSSSDLCGPLEGRIIEELIFNYPFVIFNKNKNRYEDKIRFTKWGDNLGCCFAGFYFLDKDRFVRTRVYTDLVIIEDCDSTLYK